MNELYQLIWELIKCFVFPIIAFVVSLTLAIVYSGWLWTLFVLVVIACILWFRHIYYGDSKSVK